MAMVLMALDHTRAFLGNAPFPPVDLAHTTPAMFFTRWVTHFCAPAFFLLAGLGASLSIARGRSVAQVSRFYLTRDASDADGTPLDTWHDTFAPQATGIELDSGHFIAEENASGTLAALEPFLRA